MLCFLFKPSPTALSAAIKKKKKKKSLAYLKRTLTSQNSKYTTKCTNFNFPLFNPDAHSPYWDCPWLNRLQKQDMNYKSCRSTLKTLNTRSCCLTATSKAPCKQPWGAAIGFMYTHSCVFPCKAEKGVRAGPVSHVPQHWQQLDCVTGLGTKKTHMWRILGDRCWCQNKQTFKNLTSNLRFCLLKVSRVCISFVLKLPLRHIRHPKRFIYAAAQWELSPLSHWLLF